jgi:hypothetical protein
LKICWKKHKRLLTKFISSAMIVHAVGTAGVAQLVEQLICNQQVGGSNPSTSSKFHMGEFQSGQMGQTVNLLSLTSVVRIHPPPPKQKARFGVFFVLVGEPLPGPKAREAAFACGRVIEIAQGKPGKVFPAHTPFLRAAFGLSGIGTRPRGAGLTGGRIRLKGAGLLGDGCAPGARGWDVL